MWCLVPRPTIGSSSMCRGERQTRQNCCWPPEVELEDGVQLLLGELLQFGRGRLAASMPQVERRWPGIEVVAAGWFD